MEEVGDSSRVHKKLVIKIFKCPNKLNQLFQIKRYASHVLLRNVVAEVEYRFYASISSLSAPFRQCPVL
ncbi:MAG: hypothetical protein JWM16_4602 [Verrucomicrobiales bacterium]|nr:hypothetical protein [Verrucomicrobiales bacterium]